MEGTTKTMCNVVIMYTNTHIWVNFFGWNSYEKVSFTGDFHARSWGEKCLRRAKKEFHSQEYKIDCLRWKPRSNHMKYLHPSPNVHLLPLHIHISQLQTRYRMKSEINNMNVKKERNPINLVSNKLENGKLK